MGVNGVNGANTDLSIYQKLKPKQGAAASKPSYMTKEGSLWNAPGVKSLYGTPGTPTTSTIISRSPSKQPTFIGGGSNPSGTDNPEQAGNDLASSKDASAGRAAAEAAKSQQGGVRSAAVESEQNTSITNLLSANAQALGKDIKKINQKFKSNSLKQNTKFNQINNEIRGLSQTITGEQATLAGLNNELASLLNADKTGMGSHSAFSLNLAGSEQSGGVDSGADDMARIQDLQTRIGEKSNVIKMYNTQVTVLTKQSSASLRSMERVNTQYVKNNKKTQKSIQSNQAEVSTFMKGAQEANEWAVTVTNAGTTLKYAGMAFIAMGSIPVIGAGLAAAGHFMKPIGEATEAIGQFGQCAANTMMAAANIAEGNFAGALANVATAIQTGAAGVESTKAAKADFKETFKGADEATKVAEAETKTADELKEKGTTQGGSTDGKGSVDGNNSTSNTNGATNNNTAANAGNANGAANNNAAANAGNANGAANTSATANVGNANGAANTSATANAGNANGAANTSATADAGNTNGTANTSTAADAGKASGSTTTTKTGANSKAAKNAALKQEAKAAWKTLKADADKIKNTLAAFAPSSSQSSSSVQAPKVRNLTSAETRKYIDLRKSGVGKNAALKMIYGADYDNFIAAKRASKRQTA